MTPTIKLLALIEGATVTGPAKNLLAFCRRARSAEMEAEGLPRVETSIITFERGAAGAGAEVTPFVAAAREAGVEVDVVRERFRYDPRAVAQLRDIFERRAPDVVQTHMIKSHFLVRLSGLGRRRPWVAYHHGYTTTDLKMLAYNQLNRWSLPAAARVVTVCGPFAEQLARAGVARGRISVRHNSVTPPAPPAAEEVGALRARLGLAEGTRVVLAVGRLSREKGHADLVEAVAHLRQSEPALDFRLVVVGEGPERGRVEAEGRARRVSDRIIFAGHTRDVRPFYALADALALPSHSEGSPNVLLEAMAAGVPVAATRVGGVPEIAADGEEALLVAPRDMHALGAALARLLTDAPYARALAERAAARVAREFSPEAHARALVRLYRDLLGGADAAAPADAFEPSARTGV
ncbi:MAG TPA: glycosyltransferase [Pyrinomonadaceae bacterium]|jgi:glycosyltransferase involved in cell wall biosynthesis